MARVIQDSDDEFGEDVEDDQQLEDASKAIAHDASRPSQQDCMQAGTGSTGMFLNPFLVMV